MPDKILNEDSFEILFDMLKKVISQSKFDINSQNNKNINNENRDTNEENLDSNYLIYNPKIANSKINYIIKIECWQSLNSQEIEKLSISILDEETKKINSFNIEYDGNLEFKSRLKNIIIKAIDLKYIKRDSIVAFVFDKFFSDEFALGMVVLEVSKVLYKIARFKLTEFIETEKVLEKVFEIAEEIKNEGREGKKIGALFVIGEEDELQAFTKPLILNPFYGYPEHLKDIVNNDLNETIKEYAQLDGAFILSNKGIVISAGTYIDVDTTNVKRYYGWGTKHMAAVAITTKTRSIAVLVSESGNVIKLFKNGKLILKY